MDRESGQSIIEFILILPLVLGLVSVLIRVNSIIQEGIVNQKYARAQNLFISYNSPVYPEKRIQYGVAPEVHGIQTPDPNSMFGRKLNQNVNGVSENSGGGDNYEPEPPKRPIYRAGATEVGQNTRAALPRGSKRGMVRIRVTTGLCTHSIFAEVDGEMLAYQKALRSGQMAWRFCNCGQNETCTDGSGGGA